MVNGIDASRMEPLPKRDPAFNSLVYSVAIGRRRPPNSAAMPELPEVETTRRGIEPAVRGKPIRTLSIYDRRLRWPVPAAMDKALVGRTIRAVDRRSKYLLFRTDGPTLLVHLGMTGSLRFHSHAPPRRPHDHVDIVFADGSVMRYHDPRRFGAMLLLDGRDDDHPLLRGLGPEPFDPAFDAAMLHEALRRRSAAVKLALMDNAVVTGVGNIYANEALWRAGIRPTVAARTISRARLARLVDAIRETLGDAIRAGGSTLRDYVDASGQTGYFQLEYAVYGREGERCPRCGSTIRGVRLGGRASFYCPRCQR
jgi:formamidopyrimidine-DNA glycosylase